MFRKSICLYKFIQKCKTIYFKKKYISKNQSDLYLDDIHNINYFIDIYQTKRIFHRLGIKECLNLISISLSRHQDGFYKPEYPINPYTNQKLNYNQLVLIYLKATKNNIPIPKIFSVDRFCNFSINSFED